VAQLKDINSREYFILGILAILTIGMGVYPKPFTDIIHPAAVELLKHVAVTKI
jgi:NADH-quinone oxidoreductase subunit M